MASLAVRGTVPDAQRRQALEDVGVERLWKDRIILLVVVLLLLLLWLVVVVVAAVVVVVVVS